MRLSLGALALFVGGAASANALSPLGGNSNGILASCDGQWVPIAGGSDVTATGSAQIEISAVDGDYSFTSLSVDIAGTDAADFDAAFIAHVHATACNNNNGGGHFKFDDSVAGAEEANELWFKVGASVGGTKTSAPFTANLGPDASKFESVVIHNPAGAKTLCCDLTKPADVKFETPPVPVGSNTNGVVATCEDWVEMATSPFGSISATGRAQIEFKKGDADYTFTSADLEINIADVGGGVSLDNAAFKGHVHVSDCASGGGGHYKFDDSVDGAIEANEIWYNFDAATGTRSTTTTSTKKADPSKFKSIVLHASNNNNEKTLCCDLRFYSPVEYKEAPATTVPNGVMASCDSFNIMPTAVEKNIFAVGSASILVQEGKDDLTTSTSSIKVESRDDQATTFTDSAFTAHVHVADCASGGGGHYKFDDTVAGAVEENEIWFPYGATGDADGVKSVTTTSTVRADADKFKSIVIHSAAGDKTFCCDLKRYDPITYAKTTSDSMMTKPVYALSAALLAAVNYFIR